MLGFTTAAQKKEWGSQMEQDKQQNPGKMDPRKRPKASSQMRTPRRAAAVKANAGDAMRENGRGAPCCPNTWWP
jgi:hypothetical protein